MLYLQHSDSLAQVHVCNCTLFIACESSEGVKRTLRDPSNLVTPHEKSYDQYSIVDHTLEISWLR